MIKTWRTQFNDSFTSQSHQALLDLITSSAKSPVGFRVCESPIVLPGAFKHKLEEVCQSIHGQIAAMDSRFLAQAVPTQWTVPNENSQSHFLTLDFAITQNTNLELIPQLIELQGFPSLMAYQYELTQAYKKVYPFFNSLETSSAIKDPMGLLKSVLLGPHKPKEVVLLELYPEKQKTKVDFALIEKYTGIKTLCVTQIRKEGKSLYYERDHRWHPIKRVFNRVIFEQLEHIGKSSLDFAFTDDLDVEWLTHPHWFFKISKYLLPELQHPYIPKSYRLNEFPETESLENYVLKPLFSFAGSGVNLQPKPNDLRQIQNSENFILQRKVDYAPIFEDPHGEKAKAEIRVLYLWPDQQHSPVLLDTIVRMTKSDMAGLEHNSTDSQFTGSSAAFFLP